jgi:hypothetical protein
MVLLYFLYLLDILNYTNFLKNKYDMRPINNENETSISVIRINQEKINLLKYLQNINNSDLNKLEKIYDSHLFNLHNDSIYIPNITKGIYINSDW